MDPLVHLMDAPRARSAFTLRLVMSPPWSIDVRAGAALDLIVVTSRSLWLDTGAERVEAGPGDVLLVKGPEPYVASDHPARAPSITIEPGQRCVSDTGEELHLNMRHGVGTWGNDPDGTHTAIIGSYEDTGEVGRLALAALPRLARLPAGSVDPAVVALLAREITTDQVAQSVLNDRLLDCVLVMAVRAWLASHPGTAPNRLSARHDPVVAQALDLVHARPAEPWNLESLARECAVSRATLAARFSRAVGTPPMSYLRTWRLTLACDLLVTEPALSLAAVASRVGYGSAFAFSAAFKTHRGLSPSEYRRAGHPRPTFEAPSAGPTRT